MADSTSKTPAEKNSAQDDEEGWSTVTGKSSSNATASSTTLPAPNSTPLPSPLKNSQRRLVPQFNITPGAQSQSSDSTNPSSSNVPSEREKGFSPIL